MGGEGDVLGRWLYLGQIEWGKRGFDYFNLVYMRCQGVREEFWFFEYLSGRSKVRVC